MNDTCRRRLSARSLERGGVSPWALMKDDSLPKNECAEMQQKVLLEERTRFFSQMQPHLFTAIFGALEGVIFFIKDRAGRFITITRGSGI